MIFGRPIRPRPGPRPRLFRPHARGFGPRYVQTTYIPEYIPAAISACVPDTATRLPPCSGVWVRRGNAFCCEG
jgi:hypothetical protein